MACTGERLAVFQQSLYEPSDASWVSQRGSHSSCLPSCKSNITGSPPIPPKEAFLKTGSPQSPMSLRMTRHNGAQHVVDLRQTCCHPSPPKKERGGATSCRTPPDRVGKTMSEPFGLPPAPVGFRLWSSWLLPNSLRSTGREKRISNSKLCSRGSTIWHSRAQAINSAIPSPFCSGNLHSPTPHENDGGFQK